MLVTQQSWYVTSYFVCSILTYCFKIGASDEICLPDITDAFSDDSSFEGSLTSMSSNFDTDSDKNDTTMEECDLDYGGA